MVLIISDENEPTTDFVLRWIKSLNKPFVRINGTDKVEIKNLKLNNNISSFFLVVNGITIDFKDIDAFYFRRGFINLNINYSSFSEINLKSIKECLKQEIIILQDFIHFIFENSKNSIGSFDKRGLNKLKILSIAKNLEINIPDTLIVDNKQDLSNILKEYDSLITKNIYEITHIKDYKNNLSIGNATDKVNKNLDTLSSDSFLNTLFQQEIKKDFEVRTFYLNGKCYSAAILSQQNSKTQVDFRNYDDDLPNRVVPYNLPEDIEAKTIKLMNSINLNTGSIDWIYSEGKYYFLEINPVGQFGMVSYPCNYYLEKIVAEELIQKRN